MFDIGSRGGVPISHQERNLRDAQERRAIATPANQEPRINDRIRAREVRLVGPEGDQIGVRPLPEAIAMAHDLDLDLVEVADKADPPVCRIMDYGKYKYEQSQRAKESRKKATHILVKEMKYRPKIGPGDFDTKTRKVEEFLGDGSKVKVTIMFRGREMQHPELGRRILDRVAEAVEHVGRIETYPKLEGRNMTMLLGPGQATRRQREEAVAREHAEAEARAAAEAEAEAEAEGGEVEAEDKAEGSVTTEAAVIAEPHRDAQRARCCTVTRPGARAPHAGRGRAPGDLHHP